MTSHDEQSLSQVNKYEQQHQQHHHQDDSLRLSTNSLTNSKYNEEAHHSRPSSIVSTLNQINLVEYQNTMEEMKKSLFSLKTENYQLKQELKQRTEQDILNDSSASGSETDELKEFKKNKNDIDITERFDDTMISYNQIGLNKILRDNTMLQKSLEKLNEDYLEMKTKFETSETFKTHLMEENSALKKQFEDQKEFQNIYEILKKECEIQEDKIFDAHELVSIFKNKLFESSDVELKRNMEVRNKLENIINCLVSLIETIFLFQKSNDNQDVIVSLKNQIIEEVSQNSSDFNLLDPDVFIKSIDGIVQEILAPNKSLTQHKMSELNADVTEINQSKYVTAINTADTTRNHTDFAAFSTPCFKMKRVEELKSSFANVSSELFKSVSNIKNELSSEHNSLTAQSTRLSGIAFNQPHSASATYDQSTINETTHIFDRSDANMARMNQFVVKLEKLVEQNNELQEEMIEYIETNKNMKEIIDNHQIQYQEKEQKIAQLNLIIEKMNHENSSMNSILVSVQQILESDSFNTIINDLEILVKELNEIQISFKSKGEIIEELNNKISSLETENKSKDINIVELNEMIKSLQEEINCQNNNNLNNMSSIQATKDHTIDDKFYNDIHQLKNLINNKHEFMQWNDIKYQIVSLLDSAEPLYNLNMKALSQLKSLQHNTDEFKCLSKQTSIVSESCRTKNDAIKFEDLNLKIQEYISVIDDLKNHIVLLENEVAESNNQVELIKISKSIPDNAQDPKIDKLIEQMNTLQSLLDKSYISNKMLRNYLKNSALENSKKSKTSSSTAVNVTTSNPVDSAIRQRVFGQEEMSRIEQSIHDSLAILTNLAKHVKAVSVLTLGSNRQSNLITDALQKEMNGNISKCKRAMKVMQKKLLSIYRLVIYDDTINISKLSPNRPIVPENDERSKENKIPSNVMEKQEKSFEKFKGKAKDMIDFFEKK